MSDSSEPDNDRPDAGAPGGERPGYGDPTRQPGYPGPPGGGASPERGASYGQHEPQGQEPQGQEPQGQEPQGQEPQGQEPQGPYGTPPGDQQGGQSYPQSYPQSGGQSYPQNYPEGNQQGYQQPGGYYGAYMPVPDHPQATTALTLGLVGMIGTMICGVPAVVGPFAWYVGARAKREIDASGGQLGGRGQALTGFVLGIITTVLLVIGILVLGALIAVGIAGGFEAAG